MAVIVFKIILLSFIFVGETSADESIRVLIMNDAPSVTIESPSGFKQPSGVDSNRIVIEKNGINHNPLRIISNNKYLILNGKKYRGSLEVRKKNGGLYVINELGLEDYLKGVVPQEIDHRWDMEALKAQAVVARTYALFYKRGNNGKDYDLESSIMSQVYNGMDGEKFRSTFAVMETEGIVLIYEGELIEAFYHASCGGSTENSGEIWSKDAPYLRSIRCPETSQSWERKITFGEIEEALRKDGEHYGKVIKVEISATTNTGRVSYIKITLKNGNGKEPLNIRGNDFRRIFGYTRIPSANFRIESNGDAIVLTGKGAGHGVGFCQFGAKEMSEKGKGFKEILKHYYRGVEIGNFRDL